MLDDGRVVLERQHRHPIGQVMIEFPAGKLDAGEDRRACAERELREETGYVAREWAHAGVMHPVISYSTEFIDIWFARGLTAGERRSSTGEFLDVFTASRQELLQWCRDGPSPMPRRCPARCGCRTSSRARGHWTGAHNPAMKVLNLQCSHRHGFEGWFGSEDDFQDQLSRGLVECPFCGDVGVAKLPSAPRLNLGAQQPARRSRARKWWPCPRPRCRPRG
jgi:hypothetical protein